jgi:hypothetical protein
MMVALHCCTVYDNLNTLPWLRDAQQLVGKRPTAVSIHDA